MQLFSRQRKRREQPSLKLMKISKKKLRNKSLTHYKAATKRDEAFLKTVDKIRAQKEAEAERREKNKKERARKAAVENLKFLNKQCKEKEKIKEKKKAEHVHIKEHLKKVTEQLKIDEAKKMKQKKESQLSYRKMLDEQIKERERHKRQLQAKEKPFWLYS
mmetsp:Transcript_17902/g.29152  ORF Transcript_17902/g.29152 Transcript_17902/m.29152 type:complete len:161 (-) Transcript_17902:476-958(-)